MASEVNVGKQKLVRINDGDHEGKNKARKIEQTGK